MKTINQFIYESRYVIQPIDTYAAIHKIMHTKNYPTLKNHVEDEIDDDGNIININGKNTKNNEYTCIEEDAKYKWLVLMNGKKEIALQLINWINKDELVLVIAERSKRAINEKETFKNILNSVIKEYHPKKIHTFALHDKLKEKYISYGFVVNKDDQLTLTLN